MATPPGKRISDDVREAILADARTGTMSVRAIAERHGVSRSTVSTYARGAGLTFDRTRTAAATQARTIDLAARRAELKAALLDDIDRLRARAWSPYPITVNTKDGPITVQLPLPELRDQRDAYTAIGVAITKHVELERVDKDRDAGPGASMVGELATALGLAYEQMVAEEHQAEGAADGP